MSWILRHNGSSVVETGGFNGEIYAKHTGTSYPAEVPQDYVWEQDGYWLGWVDDPVPTPPTAEELLAAKRGMWEVSALKAQQALHLTGKLPQVQMLMQDPNTDPMIVLAWNKAQTFKRMSPTVLGMAAILGLSDIQLDDLFSLADSLPDA